MRGLSRDHTLIRFDHRGFGLSDRVVASDLDEWVRDIEAVAERCGFREFALFGIQLATPAAITFAARHPKEVSRFIILDGFASWVDFLRTPQVQAIQSAARLDFGVATEAIGFAAFGEGRDESRDHGAYIRACVSQEQFSAYDTYDAWDSSQLANSVTAPTLILKHSGVEYATMEMAKDLAARIPDAQLTILDGGWADDVEGIVDRVAEFTGTRKRDALVGREQPSGTAIILFADIADSTALTERLGDAAFRAKARTLDAALRDAIREHGGSAIEGKTLGDGVLAVFQSAREAIGCAQACHDAASSADLSLHVGIHAGDVIRESDNVYGGAVNIAAEAHVPLERLLVREGCEVVTARDADDPRSRADVRRRLLRRPR